MQKLSYSILIFLSVSLCGCILVPFVESFHQAGLTESDRQRMLGENVKHFSSALTWGDKQQAMTFAKEGARQSIYDQFKNIGDTERIVDSKISDVVFLESAYKANVDLNLRYYKIPVYTVQDRIHHQVWEFDVASGWKLTSSTITKNG